jgi:DIS3-like exonuclease 2
MRATEEHTAAVPISAPPPPAAEDAEKEKRKNRRRPARRPKQAGAAPAVAQGPTHADAAGPRPCRSMPPMHVGGADAEAEEAAAGTSHTWPLLPTPGASDALARNAGSGGAAGRRYFQPHWPEQAVEEASKVFSGLMGGLQLCGSHFGRTDTLFLCLCLAEGSRVRWEVPSECTQPK